MTEKSQTVLITGASSGLGAALAIEYAGKNSVLYLNGRNAERLGEVADKCRLCGAKDVVTFSCDVTNRELIERWIEKCDSQNPIDICIANAGISGGTGEIEQNAFFAQAQRILDVNITGVMNTIKPAGTKMLARQSGHLIIISSLASFSPWPGAPAYAASKAAVRVFGEGLIPYLRKNNVYVSVVCPGFVESNMTAQNNFPMPFKWTSKKAAKKIIHDIKNKKKIIAFPIPLYVVIKMLSFLPLGLWWLISSGLPQKGGLRHQR
ncbi:MAG: short-chain dehydrogenase [Alphaproteobacteria bacterium]|nr:short-chain dehydrogenase [Alphaproteobacteria bacterium]